MPDLELGDQKVIAGCWLVARGQAVVQGDRLLELRAGDVLVDLPAPATGRLDACSVDEGQCVLAGQVLGAILAGDSQQM